MLRCNAYFWHVLPGNILDTDDFLVSAEETWAKCIAHLTQPMTCDKEWDKVIVDRSHLSPPNLKYDEKGNPIFWYQTPEYKEIYEKEVREREEIAKKEYDEWIKKKEKQNEYQRKRRALIKERKKNGVK